MNTPPISYARDLQAPRLQDPNQKKIKELSQEFESFFLHHVFRSMRKTIPKNEMFHGGNSEDIFRDLLDGQYALQFAQKEGGMGLAQAIEKQLLGQYGKNSAPGDLHGKAFRGKI